MKRTFCMLLICLLTLPAFAPSAAAVDEPELDMARFAYVYNTDYDQVLYALNEDKILYPASTAKMMTAILALEYYEGKIDTRITITQEMLDLSGGTVVSYKLGEVLSVEQLLYGLVVANGNDAAYALALSIAGTVDGFVTLMNQKAAALGAKDTRYANPTGVDHNSAYTTAADVARIAAYAARMEAFITISSCKKYTMGETNMSSERVMANKNYVVSDSYVSTYYLSYATGLNAGTTTKGGHCCVVTATKDGLTNVVVVMNVGSKEDDSTNYAFKDAKTLMQWSYSNYGYEKVLTHSEIVCEIPVSMSAEVDHVALLPGEDVYLYLPQDADIENDVARSYELTEPSLTAPVEGGSPAGEMILYYQGAEVGRVALVTKSDVAGSPLLKIGAFFKSVFLNLWTLILALVLLAAIVFWIFFTAYTRARRKH